MRCDDDVVDAVAFLLMIMCVYVCSSRQGEFTVPIQGDITSIYWIYIFMCMWRKERVRLCCGAISFNATAFHDLRPSCPNIYTWHIQTLIHSILKHQTQLHCKYAYTKFTCCSLTHSLTQWRGPKIQNIHRPRWENVTVRECVNEITWVSE